MRRVIGGAVASVLAMSCMSSPLYLHVDRFHSVKGFRGAVASQEVIASKVGRDILKQGGNAVDAAVATGFALMVTLPRAGGLGGGGFMTIWLQKQHKSLVIDYRETAPKHIHAAAFLNQSGKLDPQKARHSGLAVAVPGNVAGLCFAERTYGKLGLKKVISPAIKLASQGIVVTQALAGALAGSKKVLSIDPDTLRIFSTTLGALVKQGDVLKRPGLAHALRLIKKKGAKAFYTGAMARALIRRVREYGGVMTLADLKHYRPIVRKPLRIAFGSKTVLVPPSPASGLTLGELLLLASKYPLSPTAIQQNTALEFHLLTEMMNFAYFDRNQYLGDPQFVNVPQKKLLSKQHISSIIQRISREKHLPSLKIQPSPMFGGEGRNTTHYSVVDRDGNMVSNTYSLNYSFGSGISVPRYGILLNNTMDDFALQPGTPNSFGLVQGNANRVQGGKRPLSSMTPIIVLDHHRAWLATGSPGGSKIITTVFQLLVNMIDYELPLATAVERPRIHSQLFPDQISVEWGISPDTIAKLRQMGHKVVTSWTQGSLQSVQQRNGHFVAFSDTRRLGAGVAVY